MNPKTVEDRIRQFGPAADARLKPYFAAKKVSYPPAQLALIGLKREKLLLVYAAGKEGPFKFIRSYPIVKASGELGPKLCEGDGQVPEGIYRIESLNPNSRFHLSLRINYPNAFDRKMEKADGRTKLGGDIMIHGSSVSIGCLAMGDEVAEDLFVLAEQTGLRNIEVILSPVDFRVRQLPKNFVHDPPWVKSLYEQIRAALGKYPAAR
jgi:murein L,D-transpeptidase YafK